MPNPNNINPSYKNILKKNEPFNPKIRTMRRRRL